MTNEVRLIDANALKEALEETTWFHLNKSGEFVEGAEGRESAFYMAKDIFNLIDNAPTATIDNYAFGYQDGIRKVLSELEEQGHEFGNIFGDCKPTFESAIREEQENE